MKITNLLLAFLFSLNLSWTPCHASSEPLPETDTTNLWNNKYIQGTALALSTSFVAYKYLIAPSIENCHETLLNACESGNLLLFKLFHLLGAKQIVEHGYTYLNEAYDNDHLEIVKYLLNIPPFDKHKSLFLFPSNSLTLQQFFSTFFYKNASNSSPILQIENQGADNSLNAIFALPTKWTN